MSIPALGGGSNPTLQRALMDAAERALADEAALLAGEGDAPGTTSAASSAGASSAAARGVRRRAADATGDAAARLLDEAIVVELGEPDHAERLEVAGGWITAARRGPLETRSAPAGGAQTSTPGSPTPTPGATTSAGSLQPPSLPAGASPAVPSAVPAGSAPAADQTAVQQGEQQPGQATGQATVQQPGQATGRLGESITLDRLLVVLKKTGIDFRDAYQVLKEIHAGEPLPPRAELQARWAAADPAAWEERAHVQQQPASSQAGPEGVHQQAAAQAARARADADLQQTPIDHLIRDRAWHRATSTANSPANAGDAETSPARTSDDRSPTLQTIGRPDAANQAYVAGLSTAEFQRLVTILGVNAPAWFWDVRGHRGLRGLAERPAIARLNATRIAGTRLGAWILAMLGMAVLWYVGIHTDVWW